jgi:hypothetical protein
MKFIITTLFLFTLLCGTSAQTVRVFILSGQSNAGGNGNGDELTAEQIQTNPEVLVFFGGKKAAWQPMYPKKQKKEKFNIDALQFGTEMSFSKAIKKAYPNDIVAICKVALSGGTSIVAWEKNHDKEGWKEELEAVGSTRRAFNEDGTLRRHHYNELIDDTKRAIEQLNERDDVTEVIISGMWWVQTEADGKHLQSATNYEKNLRTFVKNVRQDLDVKNMPFLFMDTHIKNNERTRAIMTEGFKKIEKDMPQTGMVQSKDLPTYEGVHFTTEGIWELGERFAEKYLQIKMFGK